MEEVGQKRQGFGSKFGFIMATAGSAIGLGNLWGFPFKAGMYGGAAFVLVYCLMVLLIGIVVMVAEIQLGKRSQANTVVAFTKVHPKLRWIGLLCVLIPFLITSYYTVIGGWSLKYVFNYIFEPGFIASMHGSEYFAGFITQAYEPVLFTILFFTISVVIVCGGIKSGIEKASKIMMPALFVLLVIAVVRALTLGDGVKEGLEFYILKLDFVALGWKGVLAAMGQAFYSLSLGMGIMLAYGSYSGKQIKVGQSALIVSLLDTGVALLAGFAIFPAVFAFGLPTAQGPSLLFAVMPEVFREMAGGQLFGLLFFALVVLAATTSVISLLEVVSQYTIDKFNWSRKKATIVFASAMAFIGIFVSLSQGAVPQYSLFGFDLLTLLDDMTNVVFMPIAAIASCIIAGWVVTPKVMISEIRADGDRFVWGSVWGFLVKYVTPLLILVVLVFGIVSKLEESSQYLGVVLTCLAIILLLIAWNFIADSKYYQSIMEKRANSEEQEHQDAE